MNGKHLVANGIRLHYLHYAGKGQALVLVPGITSPAITWGFVAERLSEFSDVYVLDNRGRGLSSGGADLGYTLADYAADAAGFIEALGLGAPVVLGHSMGGRIGFSLAADYPHTVGRLIAADPPVTGPGRPPYPVPGQWYVDGIEAAERGEEIDRSSPLLKNWTDEQIALRMEWLPTCDKTAVLESHRLFHEEDVHGFLPKISCPTLLMYAENGNTVSDDAAQEVKGLIPNCRTVKIRAVGHMIPWDDLDAFVSETRAFVTN